MITKTDIEYGKLYSFKEGLAEGEAKGISISDICDLTGLSELDLASIPE